MHELVPYRPGALNEYALAPGRRLLETAEVDAYFAAMAASEDEQTRQAYAGLDQSSQSISWAINRLVEAPPDVAYQTTLSLKPGLPGSRMPLGELGDVNLALKEAFYGMTFAQLRADEVTPKSPAGRVWYEGSYRGRPTHFVETYAWFNETPYMSWQLVSDVPIDLTLWAQPPSINSAPGAQPEDPAMADVSNLTYDDLVAARHSLFMDHKAKTLLAHNPLNPEIEDELDYHLWLGQFAITDFKTPDDGESLTA